MAAPECEAELTSFTIGMWRVRTKPNKPILVLSLPEAGKLVFLVDRSTTRASESRGVLREVGRDLQKRMRTNSPFNANGNEKWNAALQLIVAFEVSLDSVVGIDWSRPLVHDGRVVLEAHAVVKRIFRSVHDARDFYEVMPALRTAAAAMQTLQSPPPLRSQPDRQASVTDHSDSSVPLVSDAPFTPAASRQAGAASPSQTISQPVEGHLRQQLRQASGMPVGCCSQPDVDSGQQEAWRQSSAPVAMPAMLPPKEVGWPSESGFRRFSGSLKRQDSDLAASPSKVCHPPPGGVTPRRLSSGSWPMPAHWTVQSQQYAYRSICCTFTDDKVARLLRPVIEGDERLLRLYETGLQVWAIFLPQFGVWYRPWMRTVTWILFILISVFSLATGFYDLYKHTPYVDEVLRRALSGLRLQAVAAWLESHVKFRLSILLTYIFGNSMYAMRMLQWGLGMARYMRSLAQPAIDVMGPPLEAVRDLAAFCGSQLLGSLMLLLSPLVALLQMLGAMLSGMMLPLKLAWASVAQAAMLAVTSAKSVGGMASVGKQASSQVPWWSLVLPMDVLRVSGIKVARGLQATLKFFAQVCSSLARHRLTLTRRLRRRWRAFCAAVQQQAQDCRARARQYILHMKAEWTPTEPLTFKPASAGGSVALPTGSRMTADSSSAVLAATEQHLKAG